MLPRYLLGFLISFREENHFHEELCELIFEHLHEVLNPEQLAVACFFTRRGGIDINPVRTTPGWERACFADHIDPLAISKQMFRQ